MLGTRRHRLLILALTSTALVGGSASAAEAAVRAPTVDATVALAPRNASAPAAYGGGSGRRVLDHGA